MLSSGLDSDHTGLEDMVESERIRVLHVIWTSQIGGITMNLRDLIKAIDEDRYEISVCVLADGNLDLRSILSRPVQTNLLHVASGYDLVGVWRFCWFLRSTPCDVIHSHTFTALVALAIAICRPLTPRIFQEHGGVINRRSSWRTRLAFRFVARFYDTFIAVSAPLVEDLKKASIDRRSIRVIENAVDADVFGAELAQCDARKRLGVPMDGFIVGTACRLVHEKDVDLFLRAARGVRDARRDVRFLVAGSGPLEMRLRRLAQEYALGDAIDFLGPRTDMPVVWRAMDVFLFTSLTETFGRTLLESQACMTPVVAPRQVAGGAAELIALSPGILAVESREPEQLAEGVLRLLGSEPLRNDMARAGRDWVIRYFGVREWAAKMESLYYELCEAQPTP
jgi:glycosyltransferase involved in cell wall biosynthesis